VVLEESVKSEETMEFAYEETEETEGVSPECFGAGFRACAA
jgi:hypothetical protein